MLALADVESGGMYIPLSRKDLILLIRRRDDADGESSMMGSGRRPGLVRLVISAGLSGMPGADAPGRPPLLRYLPRNASACLWM